MNFKQVLKTSQVLLKLSLPIRNANHLLIKTSGFNMKAFSMHSQAVQFFSANKQQSSQDQIISEIKRRYSSYDNLVSEGRYEEGLKELKEAIRLEEENSFNSATKCLLLGVTLFKLRKYQESLDFLESKKKVLNTSYPNMPSKTGEYLFYVGSSLLNLNQLDRAVKEFGECARYYKANPEPIPIMLPNALQMQGLALSRQGKDVEAVEVFENAIEILKKYEKKNLLQKKMLAELYGRSAASNMALSKHEEGEIRAYDSKQIWLEIEGNKIENPTHFNTILTFVLIRIKRGKFKEACDELGQLQVTLLALLENDKQEYVFPFFRAQILNYFAMIQRNKAGEVTSEELAAFLSSIKERSSKFSGNEHYANYIQEIEALPNFKM